MIQTKAVPDFGETRKNGKNIYVESGGVTVEVPQQDEGVVMTVFSPHAKIETLLARFSVSVTPTSTRIEIKAGKVRFTRASDRVAEEIGPGESRMASQEGSM
jgi:ferric-dicitrate binding protein FerR (iron transport regulator)